MHFLPCPIQSLHTFRILTFTIMQPILQLDQFWELSLSDKTPATTLTQLPEEPSPPSDMSEVTVVETQMHDIEATISWIRSEFARLKSEADTIKSGAVGVGNKPELAVRADEIDQDCQRLWARVAKTNVLLRQMEKFLECQECVSSKLV